MEERYLLFSTADEEQAREIIESIRDFVKNKEWVSVKEIVDLLPCSMGVKTSYADYRLVWKKEDFDVFMDTVDFTSLDYYRNYYVPAPIKLKSMTDENSILKKEESFDPVSNPSHYTEGRIYEPRKVIADWGLNFNLGNAVKYLARAGRKGDSKIQDLRKAIQYIEFEIEEESKS